MSNKPKIFESKKLHYGTYLYRLALTNPFSPWFRTEFQKDGKLNRIKEKLNEYQLNYDKGETLYRTLYRTEKIISNEEFYDAKTLYQHLLSASSEYKIRVERWDGLNLYSNDREFLFNLIEDLHSKSIEFYEPNINVVNTLLNEKNIILVDKKPDLPLKITFNYKKINSSLADWLEANTDKSRAGVVTLTNIKSGWANGCYIFLRDERVLMMVQMIAGQNIQRIEKLVYNDNIDK